MGVIGVCSAQTTGTANAAAANPTPQAASLNSSVGSAQTNTNANEYLYNGGAIGANGVAVKAWGGGSVSQDDKTSMIDGGHSLLIESPGIYQGGTITFAQPIDLGDTSDKTRYLQISLTLAPDPKFPPAAPTDTSSTLPTHHTHPMTAMFQTGNFNGNANSLFKLVQTPAQIQQYIATHTPEQVRAMAKKLGLPVPANLPPDTSSQSPTSGDQNKEAVGPPPLPAQSVHLTMTFADGSQTDITRPLSPVDEDQKWITVGLPICKLPITNSSTHPQLTALTICTDAPCLVNVGRVSLVTDTTPITCSTGGGQDIAVNDSTMFEATASGGASTLSYQWDFDTQGSFVPQGSGLRAFHTYTTPGSYRVTLVVSDMDGIKAPATSTGVVHVEQ
jgi:hypothetical protein